jgi:hypothetical protein
MKLDRNQSGRGKYEIINNRRVAALSPENHLAYEQMLSGLEELGVIDHDEGFFIKLKDINAPEALESYAIAARQNGDQELAADVDELSNRALYHPNRKKPD